jgi:hypothetical protein
MAELFGQCMMYLQAYGYPSSIAPIANRYFEEWVKTVLGHNEALAWWKQKLRDSQDPLTNASCGMWLAGQLYNNRRTLVDIALKHEEPDNVSPDTFANLKAKMLVWKAWNQEQRPKLIEFLNIPDLDATLYWTCATLYTPPDKRQRVELQPPAKDYSTFAQGVAIGKDIKTLIGFECDGVRYFSTRQFLYSIGVTGVINDPISRPMTGEEITFIASLSESDQISIMGTLLNWEHQTVFSETDLEILMKDQPDLPIQLLQSKDWEQ